MPKHKNPPTLRASIRRADQLAQKLDSYLWTLDDIHAIANETVQTAIEKIDDTVAALQIAIADADLALEESGALGLRAIPMPALQAELDRRTNERMTRVRTRKSGARGGR